MLGNIIYHVAVLQTYHLNVIQCEWPLPLGLYIALVLEKEYTGATVFGTWFFLKCLYPTHILICEFAPMFSSFQYLL